MEADDGVMGTSRDPRVRRTRQAIREALCILLQEKAFADISVTDITRQADIARVTFYQHFASKEVVLLDVIASFFEQLYASLDVDALQQFMASGDLTAATAVGSNLEVNPEQLHLIPIALVHIGPEVRQLAVTSFLQTLARNGVFTFDAVTAQVLATYHVAGMLALLETYLQGQLALSATAFKAITLLFLRALLRALVESGESWMVVAQ